MGVVIIMNFPYSTCISSFFSSSIPSSLFIFKMFFQSCFFYVFSIFRSCFFIFLQYIANVTQGTFEIVKKNEIPRI